MPPGFQLRSTLACAWLGFLLGACVSSRDPGPAPVLPSASPAPAESPASPSAFLDRLLERVRTGRPIVVAKAGEDADWSKNFGWVQPLSHAQLSGLRALGHAPDLIAATFQPAEGPIPDRSALLDWLLDQDAAASQPLGRTGTRGERRKLLTYLATPLAPGMGETWETVREGEGVELIARVTPRATISLARALRRTGGQASPELRALLSDALAAQGLLPE